MSAVVAAPWFRFLWLLLVAGNGLAALLGLALVAMPAWCLRWLPGLGRPAIEGPLIPPRGGAPADRGQGVVYLRVVGAVAIAAAAVILVKAATLVLRLGLGGGGRLLAGVFPAARWPVPAWDGLWLALMLGFFVIALAALLLGALALVAVGADGRWSGAAQRWIGSHWPRRAIARPDYRLDDYLRRRPRLLGAAITLASLYGLSLLLLTHRP